jgi:hypothetical protein
MLYLKIASTDIADEINVMPSVGSAVGLESPVFIFLK